MSCGFKQRSWKDVAMGAIISMGLIGGEGKFYHWDHLSVWSYVRYVFSRAVSWSNVLLFQLFQTFAGAGTNNARLAGLLRPLSDLCEGFWTEASRIYILYRFTYIRSYQRPTVHSQRLQAAGGLLCKGPQCIVHGENRSRRIASSLCMSLPFLPHRCLTSAFRGSPWYVLVSHLIPMVWHGERISELTPLAVFRKSRPTIYGGSSSC